MSSFSTSNKTLPVTDLAQIFLRNTLSPQLIDTWRAGCIFPFLDLVCSLNPIFPLRAPDIASQKFYPAVDTWEITGAAWPNGGHQRGWETACKNQAGAKQKRRCTEATAALDLIERQMP